MLTFHEFTADNFQNIGKIQDFVFERGGGFYFIYALQNFSGKLLNMSFMYCVVYQF